MAEAHVRLLQCMICKSLEELPDYEGAPEQDDVLNYLVSRHQFPDGTPHMGNMMRVATRHWQNKSTRREIENRIREADGHTGFDTEFYATKNTLEEDALTCFQKHQRNAECGDYKSDSKRLVPDTSADRKNLGLEKYRSNTYLCHYCPVHSMVMTAKRKQYI